MKRYLPFVLIGLVAVGTIAAGTWLYRTKRASMVAANATPSATPSSPAESSSQPDDLHARGPVNAPVTLEVYGDFQCPSCATATAIIDLFQKQYANRLRVIFREFPLAMHAHAMQAALVAEAAGRQGKFWEMHDMLYKYQPVWANSASADIFFNAYAGSIGLDMDRFHHDINSMEVRDLVEVQATAGEARGVQNTPTIFINGERFGERMSEQSLKTAINAALAKKKNKNNG